LPFDCGILVLRYRDDHDASNPGRANQDIGRTSLPSQIFSIPARGWTFALDSSEALHPALNAVERSAYTRLRSASGENA
jgi:hypothetical protein